MKVPLFPAVIIPLGDEIYVDHDEDLDMVQDSMEFEEQNNDIMEEVHAGRGRDLVTTGNLNALTY